MYGEDQLRRVMRQVEATNRYDAVEADARERAAEFRKMVRPQRMILQL